METLGCENETTESEVSELERTVKDLKTPGDLDRQGKRILDLLKEDGNRIITTNPNIFSSMISQAKEFMVSEWFLEIVKEMAKIYRKSLCRPPDGLLQCLMQQMYDMLTFVNKHPKKLYAYQEDLLSLIKILIPLDNSLDSRKMCLNSLLLKSRYIRESKEFGWLQWTNDFIEVLKLLLNSTEEEDDLKNVLKRLFRSHADDEFFIPTAMRLWTNEDLGTDNCSLVDLQCLQNFLNIVQDLFTFLDAHGQHEVYFYSDPEKHPSANLNSICNLGYVNTVMEIMKIVLTNTRAARFVWTTMINYMNVSAVSLAYLEMLCLCAESHPVESTFDDLEEIFSWTRLMAVNEDLNISFLRLLIAIYTNNPDNPDMTCNLDYLGNCYIISDDVLQLANKLIHTVYGTLDDCMETWNLMNVFLWMSSELEIPFSLNESFLQNFVFDNWLQRGPLHMAAMIFRRENTFHRLCETFVRDNIDVKDVHGCTPLHLAYLHCNHEAIRFLVNHGAKEAITDHFGMTPESFETPQGTVQQSDLEQNTDNISSENVDTMHYQLCCSVVNAKYQVLGHLRPMLVLSEIEAQALMTELQTLFERLVRLTEFSAALSEVVICGSLREKLKAGRFDEADVQIRLFETEWQQYMSLNNLNRNFDSAEILGNIKDGLVKNLGNISWQDIYLRPIAVEGPWKLLREGSGSCRGIKVSVDVVPLIVSEKTSEEWHQRQKMILEDGPVHKTMVFHNLNTWVQALKQKEYIKETPFSYEWDIIDSLPTGCRLAIVTAKALVQAYDWCRGGSLQGKMPITSYVIKTALFYILAGYFCDSEISESFNSSEESAVIEALRKLFETEEGSFVKVEMRREKLKFHPNPRWTTDEDLVQHGAEARVWSCCIFKLIRFLALDDWKLHIFWNDRVLEKMSNDNWGLGEREYIIDICDHVLDCLDKARFTL